MVEEDIKIEKITIDSLVPADYNPRKISDTDYKNLKNSIDEFGIVAPIIINLEDNTIISGHQRFDVLFYENNIDELYLLKLGDIGWVFTETELKLKDKNHEKTLNLALNRIHGEFDPDKLNEVLIELEELHLDHLTGFDLELDNIDYDFISRLDDEDGYEEENYDDELEEEWDEEEFNEELKEYENELKKTNQKEKPQKTNEKNEEKSDRIRRGFIKYGDVYEIDSNSYLMFGNENNGQDRTKLLSYTPQIIDDNNLQKFKKIKTITKEINYYICNDAEVIETFIINNKNRCKKVN